MLTGNDSHLCKKQCGPCSCPDCWRNEIARRRLEGRKWYWKTPDHQASGGRPVKPQRHVVLGAANMDDAPLIIRIMRSVHLFF